MVGQDRLKAQAAGSLLQPPPAADAPCCVHTHIAAAAAAAAVGCRPCRSLQLPLPHSGFNTLLRYMDPLIISLACNLEPLIGTLLGWAAGMVAPPGAWV